MLMRCGSALAGAVLLLMRRKLAVPVLLVSLIAVIVQFSGLFLVPQLRQTVPDTALVAPIALILACYLIFIAPARARSAGGCARPQKAGAPQCGAP